MSKGHITIYPAIDIIKGKVVRLKRGDYEQMTVYNDDPVFVALKFKKAGAKALHVVDLEGAREGKPMNFEVIAKIAAETGLRTQVGGGIRTAQTVEMYLKAGISRVILGTAAVAQQGLLAKLVAKFSDAIAVSADIKDGMVAVKGWTEVSNQDISAFCAAVKNIGVKTIICTDISKDGMQQGSNIELYRTLKKELDIDIIASGGVSSIEEIKTLSEIGISGAILGKALYEGSINLSDALCF